VGVFNSRGRFADQPPQFGEIQTCGLCLGCAQGPCGNKRTPQVSSWEDIIIPCAAVPGG
jgi:hypothetical protein